MIVKMKRYSFLVFHQEYQRFLEKLRDAGVAHIHIKEEGIPTEGEFAEKLKLQTRLKNALSLLQSKGEETNSEDGNGFEILEIIEKNRAERAKQETALQLVEKELSQLVMWGDFSWDHIHRLEQAGWNVNFFSCSPNKYDPQWEELYNAYKIQQITSSIYFVTVTPEGQVLDLDADRVKVPQESLSALEAEKAEFLKKIDACDAEIKTLATKYTSVISSAIDEVTHDIEFDEVSFQSTDEVDGKVKLVEGWVPLDQEAELNQMLDAEGHAYQVDDPSLKDRVPILLKNNKFAQLFEVIGDLYSLPKYGEFDLTPFFAPFYWLFFGFCLGDAGYGLLLLVAGLVFRKKKPDMKSTMTLVSLLGLSTIIFGLIGGTFFGVNLYDLGLGFYGTLNEVMSDQNKSINDYLFNLSLFFGGIQILFGMVIKMVNEKRQYGWKYAVGTFGWFFLIVGSLAAYILGESGVAKSITSVVQYAALGIGGVCALLLNNPDRNIFVNFGAGLWDAYNMLTGIMGDLLSYIRLFALGISSSILGFVFNSLAFAFAPDIPGVNVLVIAIILVFGHGINLFMGALGSFVHPVRLTFVEFYKNAGFEGGGVRYKPFTKSK